MSDVRFNNSKFICDNNGFKITNDDIVSPEQHVLLNHDSSNVLKTIGSGSDLYSHLIPTELANDGSFDLVADSAGFGTILVGDSEEHVIFTWARDNTITLVDNSANVMEIDYGAGYFSVFDNTTSVRVLNRLGSAKKIISDIHYTELPIAPTFQVFKTLSGVDNLDPSLTINGTTVTPTLRHKGGDADGTDWNYWTYGEDVSIKAGTVPSYNQGSPCLGANDDSVKFNGGGFYESLNGTYGDIATEDIVFECIFRTPDVLAAEFIARKEGAEGWEILMQSSGSMYIRMDDGVNVNTISAALSASTWYHLMCFVNRDENSTSGSQWYVNGVASGSGVNQSTTAGTMTNTDKLEFGAGGGANILNGNIAYLAMWLSAAWHQAGAAGPTEWALVAAERFAKLCGYYPQIMNATTDITTSTRAFSAYIDKFEDGYQKLYYVGSEWLRMCHRRDTAEVDVYGYLPETQAENLYTYSEALTNWILVDAGDVVTDDVIACPDGRIAASSIAGDSTAGAHGVKHNVTLTAAAYSISYYIKPGSDPTYGKDWVNIWIDPTIYCYFDVANGTVGSSGAGATGYIEGPFYGGFYRCCVVLTGTVAGYASVVYPGDADGDIVYSGDGSTPNLYVWGAQIELGDYMTSPIITDAGTATRLKDQLRYVGGANIGGEDVGQGTIVWDQLFATYDKAVSTYPFAISDGGAAADRVYAYISGTSDNLVAVTRATAGNDGGVVATTDLVDGEKHTCAVLWETDNLKALIDGTQEGSTDTACDMPDDVDRIDIGQSVSSTLQLNGLIQNLRIYNEPTELG